MIDWNTSKAYQLSYTMSYMPGIFNATQMLTITPRYVCVLGDGKGGEREEGGRGRGEYIFVCVCRYYCPYMIFVPIDINNTDVNILINFNITYNKFRLPFISTIYQSFIITNNHHVSQYTTMYTIHYDNISLTITRNKSL